MNWVVKQYVFCYVILIGIAPLDKDGVLEANKTVPEPIDGGNLEFSRGKVKQQSTGSAEVQTTDL